MVAVRSVRARWASVLFLAGLAAGCGKKKQESPATQAPPGSMGALAASVRQTRDGVVARVNDLDIMANEVAGEMQRLRTQLAGHLAPEDQARMDPMIERQAIENAISRKLLLEQVKRENLTVPESDVDAEFQRFRGQFPDSAVFVQQLQSADLTEQTVRDRLRENLQINQLVESHTAQAGVVTPQDVEAFYRENPEQFRSPEQVRASHILVRSDASDAPDARSARRARADSILAALKHGAEFAKTAGERSDDPGSAERGGDLDYFARGQMVPSFEAAAFSLGVGQLSGVVETQYGFHILKVTDKKPSGTISLQEAQPRLAQYLQTRQKSTALREWVDELRSQAKVVVADSTGALVPMSPPSTDAQQPPPGARPQ